LLAHQFYPEAARRRGEQGTVLVRFEADRSGHVLDASVVRGSGAPALDEAALKLLRSASLPPFPDDMPLARETITIPIHYELD
jgi:protein TonB